MDTKFIRRVTEQAPFKSITPLIPTPPKVESVLSHRWRLVAVLPGGALTCLFYWEAEVDFGFPDV